MLPKTRGSFNQKNLWCFLFWQYLWGFPPERSHRQPSAGNTQRFFALQSCLTLHTPQTHKPSRGQRSKIVFPSDFKQSKECLPAIQSAQNTIHFIFPFLLAYSHMTQDTGSLGVCSLYSREEKDYQQTCVHYQVYHPPLIRFDHFSLLFTKMLMSYVHIQACVGIIYIICFGYPEILSHLTFFNVCRLKVRSLSDPCVFT